MLSIVQGAPTACAVPPTATLAFLGGPVRLWRTGATVDVCVQGDPSAAPDRRVALHRACCLMGQLYLLSMTTNQALADATLSNQKLSRVASRRREAHSYAKAVYGANRESM